MHRLNAWKNLSILLAAVDESRTGSLAYPHLFVSTATVTTSTSSYLTCEIYCSALQSQVVPFYDSMNDSCFDREIELYTPVPLSVYDCYTMYIVYLLVKVTSTCPVRLSVRRSQRSTGRFAGPSGD